MKQPVYLIHSDEYKNWIFDPFHPTQGRRFNNARDLLITSAKKGSIENYLYIALSRSHVSTTGVVDIDEYSLTQNFIQQSLFQMRKKFLE